MTNDRINKLPTINDYKKTALKNLGYTGSISDAESKYLKGLVSPYKGSIPDMWRRYLYSLGYSGSNPEMMYQYLGSLGYTGTLTNRLYKFWKNGGTPLWGAGTDYWEDFTNTNGNLPAFTDTHPVAFLSNSADNSYSSFAANVLVRTDLGIQTMPTRTQSNTNPSGTGGSVPSTLPTNWTNGGSSVPIYVGSGTEDGLPYVDLRWTGTAAGGNNSITFDSTTLIVATSGQAWSASLFCYLVAGSTTNISSFDLRLREGTAAGSQTALTTQAFTPTSVTRLGTARRSALVASTNASTERVVNRFTFTEAGSGAYDFTLRFAVPQIELGAFVSSPMLTGSTSVTGNIQRITGLGTPLATGVAGFVQFTNLSGGATSQRVLSFDDGTSNNRLQLIWADTSASVLMTTGGVSQGQVTITGINPDALVGTTVTIAFAFSNNFIMGRAVGQAAPTADTSTPNGYPVVDRLQLVGVGGGVSQSEMFRFKKIALDFGAQDATTFDAMFAKAQLA